MKQAIELKHISKSLNQQKILDDINISIETGQVVGFVGANGSGKSVLFKIIAGLMRADEGEVWNKNQQLGKEIDFPKSTGVLIDNPGYIELYSGLKNLKLLASILNQISEQEIKDAMQLVGLDPNNHNRVKNYSLGMKQKLGIAQAIMEHQDIIVLDEPFNGLDFKAIKETHHLIEQLNDDGKTILLTSHEHEYLDKLCDSLYLVDDASLYHFTEEMKQQYFKL